MADGMTMTLEDKYRVVASAFSEFHSATRDFRGARRALRETRLDLIDAMFEAALEGDDENLLKAIKYARQGKINDLHRLLVDVCTANGMNETVLGPVDTPEIPD